jgi:hypothetical protein
MHSDVTVFAGRDAQLRLVSRARGGRSRTEGHFAMRTITALALLAMLPGVAQAGIVSSGPGQVPFIRVADSAHTFFHSDMGGGGRAGEVVQLPQGGLGVTTGGSSFYQTYGAPGGGGVVVPNGNYSSVIGSGGRTGISMTPD